MSLTSADMELRTATFVVRRPNLLSISGWYSYRVLAGGNMNVLLVDDDASGMHVRELLFQSLGHQTVSAYCGSEALACFAEQEIELVVLDFCLPDLSGSEVLRQMRASRPACPVIVLSGMWDMPSLVTNMADAIVVKGTGTRPLLEAVSKHTH